MMAETRCPYCGASEDANGPRLTFECGSGGSCESSVIRAAPCYCREINGLKAENERLKAEIKKLCGKWEEDERRERKNFHFAQAQDTLAMRNQLAAILNEKGA